jgi:hypothetical protein
VIGSFVDVIFRIQAVPGDPSRRVPGLPETTITLVENVEVLAVNRTEGMGLNPGVVDVRTNVNRKPDSFAAAIKSVTLAVTPDQSNILKAATGRGELSLQLRGAHETGKQSIGPVTLEKLLGIKPEDSPAQMEIYRGGGVEVLPYDQNNRFTGGYGGNGGYGNGNRGWGSQASGGGLHYYNNLGGAGSNNNSWGAGWGWGGNVTAPMLPYPGLPPRGGDPDSRSTPNQGNGSGYGNPSGMQSTQNNNGSNTPNSVNWSMPYGSTLAYMSPYFAYPFAPPYIPTNNGR